MRTSKKKPWPTKKAMEQIYEKKLWGDNLSDYYSGDGSHHTELVNSYIEVVTSFLKSFHNPLVVCDLGCGDFNVGKQLVKHTQKYIALDIVSELIDHNKSRFKDNHLEFQCVDIAVDNLPSADCALLRQVLQHLSNTEVQSILEKLSNFKYVILTEHIPQGEFTPNKDIISGQGIRLKKQSGLDIFASPFNFKVDTKKKLLALTSDGFEGVIETWLYQVF